MSKSSDSSNSQGTKWAVAVLIFAAGLAFAVVRYRSVQAPIANAPERRPERQATDGERPERNFDGERPSREDREARRAQMIAELNLTPDQQEKMEAAREKMRDLPRGPEGMEQRIAMMAEILTPEQMEQARSSFGDRMANRMRRNANVLPPAERAKFEKKLEERQADMSKRVDNVIKRAQQGSGSSQSEGSK